MMKQLIYFLLLVFLSLPFSLLASAEGEGKADFDRQTQRLAARLQLRTYQEEFFRTFPAEAEDFLLKEMRENPRRYRNARHAADLAKKQLKQFAGTRFRAGAEVRLSCYQTGKKISVDPGEEWDKSFDKLFAALYPALRTRAVMEQRKAMLPVILPEGTDVEKLSDGALKEEISRRFAEQLNRKLLWEENETFFEKEMLPKIILSAREQQKTQLALLKEIDFPLDSWETKEIGARFTGALEKDLAAKYPDPIWRYPLFPATKREISRRAGRATYEKVIRFLPSAPLPGDYEKIVKSAPTAHRQASESFAVIEKTWLPGAIAFAMEKAAVPAEKRTLIAKDAEVQSRAAAEFTRRFPPEGKKIRNRFAENQAKTRWPELFASWMPEMEITENFVAGEKKMIPTIAARPAGEELLEETNALFDRLIREKLTQEADRLRRQQQALSNLYDDVLHAMEMEQEKEKSSFLSRWFGIGGKITLSAVTEQYEKQVSAKSSAPLFPMVQKEIEVRSRAILQQLEQQSAQKTKEENLPSLTLFLEEKGGELFLKWDNFSLHDKDPRRCAVRFREETAKRMKEGKDGSFRLQLVISGEATRYHSVALFREELQKFPEFPEVQDRWQQTSECGQTSERD